MIVAYAAALLLIIVVAAIFLGRFFAWLVEVIARYVLHLELSLGTFGLISVHGIKVKLKRGREISIDKISLQPKWTQQSSARLFTVYLENVLVSLNSEPVIETHVEEQPSSTSTSRWLRYVSSQKKTISRIIKSITKYIGLHLSQLEIQQTRIATLDNASLSCKVHQGVTILGSLENDVLSCNVSISELVTKLSVPSKEQVTTSDTLLQLSVSISTEVTLQPLQGFKLQDVNIQLSSLGVTLYEKLFLSRRDKEEISSFCVETTEDNKVSEEEVSLKFQEEIMAVVLKKLSLFPRSTVKVVGHETSVTFINEEERELTLEVGRIENTFSRDSNNLSSSIPNCSLALEISGVSLNGWKSCNLCSLNRLGLAAKLTGTSNCIQLSTSLSVVSLHNCYIHDECSYWLEYFKRRRRKRVDTLSSKRTASFRRTPETEIIPRELDLRVSITGVDCSTSLFMEKPSRKEMAVCRAVLASFTTELETCQGCTSSREICVSTKFENSYLYMNVLNNYPDELKKRRRSHHSVADNPGLLPSSCNHHWGRILGAGSLFIKLTTSLVRNQATSHLNFEGDASSLAFEWSHDVCQTVFFVSSKFKELIPFSHAVPEKSSSSGEVQSSRVSLDGQFRMQGVNIFYLGAHDGGIDSLMCRVEDVTLERSGSNKLDLTVSDMKVCRMVGMKMEPFSCRQSFSSFLEVPRFTLSIAKEKVTSVSVAEVLVTWDPDLHMALNDRVSELTEDGNNFKSLSKPQHHNEGQGDKTVSGNKDVHLKCDVAVFKLHMKTSCSTSFGVEFACGMFELGRSTVVVNAEHIHLLFDGQKTVEFEDVAITRSSEIQELASLRQSFKNLRTSSNVAYVVEVATTEIHFAYEFDFAASRDQLVNITKMLKALHRKPRDASYVEPLLPDLWLKFENLTFQMDDNPFEVMLRDNYALMLDEYEQCREREELLENRLNEIRKRPGNQLTVKKEEELYGSLQRKSAEIYIKRSKALYNESPMRTALLRWTFKGLDLRVLADESYHGKDNALVMMAELDADSPLPATGLSFSTLWCRTVKGTLTSHQCCLRDYPQPIFTSKGVKMCGILLGAEQESAERAKREAVIKIAEPWGDMVVQRSLSALKFYYDLDFDVDNLEMAWGVDIDPAIATVSLGFEYLSKPSMDPSKPLPFFDKSRLLLHGRLHMAMKEWNKYFSATRNPYETTERMEMEWRNVDLEWTNGRIVIDGDFDLHTRTASKYDDSRVLHLPAFRACFDMEWKTLGNPNDHHSVTSCAPDKVPELPPNQAHDSYAAFRSQNLTLNLSLETAMKDKNQDRQDPPTVFMYASTFRWFQKYQAVVLRNVSRPVKRGSLFARPRQQKKTLGRHYREVGLSLKFPELSLLYWASFTRQRGIELACGSGSLDLVYRLQLRKFTDGLKRRPAADWSPAMWRSEVCDVTCHLYGLEEFDGKETGTDEENEVTSIDMEPTKYYLLMAERLQYFRQGTESSSDKTQTVTDSPASDVEKYNHRVVCYDLRGVWTLTNRKIFFGLFEAYTNAAILKKNLSADALKVSVVDKKCKKDVKVEMSPSPISKLKTGSGANLLEKLVMDVEHGTRLVAHTEEGDTGEHSETPLQGLLLSGVDDVIQDTWHRYRNYWNKASFHVLVELMNSQVLVKGIETTGCVLVAAGSSRILNRLHKPVWSKGELLNKKTWVGKLENMQYFATVHAEDRISLNNIPWVDTSVITGRQEKQTFDIADLADIVGSGESVGGVISRVVGAGTNQEAPQLQRIVARCGCDFYFVSFSAELDPVAEELAPSVVPPSPQTNLQVNRQSAVNTFTIRHKLLEMSTNSVQYAMIIDICHNVVLYTEPKKKEATNKLQKLRFRLQLSTSENQRGPILELQNTVRSHQAEMRRLERELYEMNLIRNETPDRIDFELSDAMQQLEKEITARKEVLNSSSTELRLIIQAYKDFQMNMSTPTPEKAPAAEVSKIAEIYFKHATWQLNQEDGQLEIADVTFRNFMYTKTTLTDTTVEHRLELGNCNLRNLLPNSIYKDVLGPLDVSGKGHVDRSLMMRIYCRVKPPVGGIGVKEHFEVNVCPLSVCLTHRLYRKIMVFFFPHRAHEYETADIEGVDLGFRGRDIEDKDIDYDDIEEFPTLQVQGSVGKSSSLKRTPSLLSTSSSESSESGYQGSSRSRKSNLSTVDAPTAVPPSPRAKEKKKKSTFYRSVGDYADVMTERASKNNTFIYVKITEVLLRVSYKGEKEKNIVDVHNFNLALPTLEYHSRTWTWLDLLLAMKKDCISCLVSQVVKEKLRIKGATHGVDTRESKSSTREEDKAKLLFGEMQTGQPKKRKKGLFKKLTKYRHKSKTAGLCQPDGAGPKPVDFEDGFPDLGDDGDLQEADEDENSDQDGQ